MRVLLASISGRSVEDTVRSVTALYVERLGQYVPAESRIFRSEGSLLEFLAKSRGRTAPVAVFLDGRGKQLSSEEVAGWVGRQRDGGAQSLIFAIGPADGWSEAARKEAALLLSLGPMTLPHELARLVVAEQVYRAFTILAGHPYHRG